MKPLLIIPPAPGRWAAIEGLLESLAPDAREELRLRVAEGLPDAFDAFAMLPEGGRAVAHAALYRKRDRAVLRHVWTNPLHRRRGHARRLVQTLSAWFDMSGGRLIYACGSEEVVGPLLGPAGFAVLHRTSEMGQVSMARGQLPDAPLDAAVEVRAATGADFPQIVEFFQFCRGADLSVELSDSAARAEHTVAELLGADGARVLLGLQGPRVVGLGRVLRADQTARIEIMPHEGAPAALKEALERAATTTGNG